MSLENLGGGPEKSQRVPPNPEGQTDSPNPEGQTDSPNPEGQTDSPNPEGQTDSPNPEGEVNKGEGISRRAFFKRALKLGAAALSLGAVGGVGAVGGCAEFGARRYYEDLTKKFLEGKLLREVIRGIEIYVDKSSMREDDLLSKRLIFLEQLIEILRPMILILPDVMAKRIGHIVLELSLYKNSKLPLTSPLRLVYFNSGGHIDIGVKFGMGYDVIKMDYPDEFKVTPQEVQKFMSSKELQSIQEAEFIRGLLSLCVFGDSNALSRQFRETQLRRCINSINEYYKGSVNSLKEKCIDLIDLVVDRKSLEWWLEINEQKGGYVRQGYTELRPFRTYDFGYPNIIGYENFGYTYSPNVKYGRLNPFEDVVCVFGKILSSLYGVIHRKEDPEAVIKALLSETPDETVLHKKYLIACESLIKWYGENSDQRKILREFIQIIADAIKEAERSY